MQVVQQPIPMIDPATLGLDVDGTAAPAPGRPATLYATPLLPADEPERLAELRQFAILDTAAEEEYDRLVQLATVLCGTSMAALSLVDGTRIWLKSSIGLPHADLPREKSFCAYAIVDPERVLEIPDVSRLGWADAQPWGDSGPTLAFYAGAPLRTREGSAIGTL